MALAAVGSFLITLVLAVSTILLWRETKRLAAGAEIAITDLERPYLTVSIPYGGIRPTLHGLVAGFADVVFTNQGRGPAILERIAYEFQWTELPRVVKVKDAAFVNIPNEVLSPGASSDAFHPFPFPIQPAGKGDWWLVGYLVYSDLLRIRYVTGFTMRLDDDGFFRLTHPAGQDGDYNYTRKLESKPSTTPFFRPVSHG